MKRILLLFREAFCPLIIIELQLVEVGGEVAANGGNEHRRDAIHHQFLQLEGARMH